MINIIIKHIIEAEQIRISFDMQDGSLSFTTVNLDIKSDIDLNNLLMKLTELIEVRRELEIVFEDPTDLFINDSKIKLIKKTLQEIYDKFNEEVKPEDILDVEFSTITDVSESNSDLLY